MRFILQPIDKVMSGELYDSCDVRGYGDYDDAPHSSAWEDMWNTKAEELFICGSHGYNAYRPLELEGMRAVVPIYVYSDGMPDDFGRAGQISEAHHRIVSLYMLGYEYVPCLEFNYRDRCNAYGLLPFDTTTTDPDLIIREVTRGVQ